MYVTDSGHYLSHDERVRAESEINTLLAKLEGQQARRRRQDGFLRGGLGALRRQPALAFQSVSPREGRKGRALLVAESVKYI